MDLLDLHGVLFSRAFAGERIHERLCHRRTRCDALAGPVVLIAGVSRPALGRGNPEHHWVEYREMVAECWRSSNVPAVGDAGWRGGVGVLQTWVDDVLHLGKHEAYLELGYGELLVADRVCVFRA